jgi:hypothetical protein
MRRRRRREEAAAAARAQMFRLEHDLGIGLPHPTGSGCSVCIMQAMHDAQREFMASVPNARNAPHAG